MEVETPVLQPRYGGAFAHPFVTHSNELDADLYLRIATELYLKRLIVGGLERVYEIGKDFRNEGVSYKHQPEFTMLEWYEAYADYTDTMARIETLLERVAREVTGGTVVTFRGHEVDLKPPWARVKFVELLERLELLDPRRGGAPARGWRSGVLTRLRTRTGRSSSTTRSVISWSRHSSSRRSSTTTPSNCRRSRYDHGDPSLTERFEYFAAGMELGNAYSEINDPAEQGLRFDEQSEHVEGVRGDPDYVEALAYGMPPTAGLGLGVDRLADAAHRAGDDPGRHSLSGAASAGLGEQPAREPVDQVSDFVRRPLVDKSGTAHGIGDLGVSRLAVAFDPALVGLSDRGLHSRDRVGDRGIASLEDSRFDQLGQRERAASIGACLDDRGSEVRALEADHEVQPASGLLARAGGHGGRTGRGRSGWHA